MDGYRCPECHRDITLANIMYRVAPCGHRYCDNCVVKMFKLDESHMCMACPAEKRLWLGSEDFHAVSSSEARMGKEKDIRREVLREWNKVRENFESEREYDDYLEQVEDLIQRRTRRPDDDEAHSMMERNRAENKELILRNNRERERRLLERRNELRLAEQQEADRMERMIEDLLGERWARLEEERDAAAELAGVKLDPIQRPHVGTAKDTAPSALSAVEKAQAAHTAATQAAPSGADLVRSRMQPVYTRDEGITDSAESASLAAIAAGVNIDAYFDNCLKSVISVFAT